MKLLRFFPILLLLSVLTLTTCSSSNTTKVTVYFSKPGDQAILDQKKLPLIDRFLNLFSSEAYAQRHQTQDTAGYILWVTADDFESISIEAAETESSISIDVPSGNNRVFTLLSLSSITEGNYNYIGQSIVNLTGEETSISLNMYPCVYNILASSSSCNSVTLSWNYDQTLYTKFSNLTIYRACFGDDPSCSNDQITPVNTVALDVSTGGYSGTGTYIDNALNLTNVSVPAYQTFIYLLSVNPITFPGITFTGNFEDVFSNNQFIPLFLMTAVEVLQCAN